MAGYQFDTGAMATDDDIAGVYYRVQVAEQVIPQPSGTPLSSVLPSVSFSGLTTGYGNPLTLYENPFTWSDIDIQGAPDAGQQSVGILNFECHNEDIGNDFHFGNYLMSIDKDTTALHIRIGRSTDGVTFTYKFHGVVRFDSIEATYDDFDDANLWSYKFEVADSITQLEDYTVADLFNSVLKHTSYDYKTSDFHLTYVGTASCGGAGTTWTTSVGPYSKDKFRYTERGDDGVDRYLWYDTADLRFIKVTDIFQSVALFLGLTTNVNAGLLGTGIWSEMRFGVWHSSQMNWYELDKAYLISGFWDSGDTVYKEDRTCFDPLKIGAYSFYACGNALEMLKNILVSFGMMARIGLDASGNRVLYTIPMNTGFNVVTPATSNVAAGAKFTPYARAISGCEVTVGAGTNVLRGGKGNGSINVNCLFGTANNTRAVAENWTGTGPGFSMVLDEHTYSALYVSPSTPTGTRNYTDGDALTLAEMYSVGAVTPSGTAGSGTNAYVEEYGEISPTGYGLTGQVMYPRPEMPYNCWTEAVGMALAHILYSPIISDDDFSLYRKAGQTLEMEVIGIPSVCYYPGDLFQLTIGGVAQNWRVVSYKEKLEDDTYTVTLERFA